MAMQLISENFVYSLWNNPQVSILEYHAKKPKVIETDQATIIKLFHPKSWHSSNNILPYASRFTKNAEQLAAMGLVVPKVINLSYCRTLKIHLVEYQKIEGEDFGTLMKQEQYHMLSAVLAYVGMLHERGIYFRAIHLSNLIYQASGKIGLIDITDLKIKPSALSLLNRYRNLKHLFSNKTDKPHWHHYGVEKTLAEYVDYAALPAAQSKLLKWLLRKTLTKN